MCRNITTLRGLEPGATPEEIEAGARQYVRKISGVQKTSPATYEVFERAVAEIAAITARVINELPPRKEPPKTRAAAAPPQPGQLAAAEASDSLRSRTGFSPVA